MSNSFLKNSAYALFDLVTLKRGVNRRINNMDVRFPVRWSQYYEDNYEADNYSFLRSQVKPGMHILDIGAHLGLFSAISSKLAGDTGKIVCFEPTPGTYSVLLETLKLNRCKNVVPVLGAVSSKEGSATFYVSATAGCNSNSLVKNKPEEEAKGNEVKLFTIDGCVQQYSLKPGLIKIDAEGAELDVLKGGLNTFRDYKPILIVGLHPDFINKKGDSLENIWNLLQESGYQVKENDNSVTKSDFCNRTLLFDVHCI